MCTRKNAKKSQVLKIVRPSSHVKKNFYELWKFIVDLAVHLGGCRWNFWMRRTIFRTAEGLRGRARGGRRPSGCARLRFGRPPPPEPVWNDRRQSAHIHGGFRPCARRPLPPAACRLLPKRASFTGPQARIMTDGKLMTWHDAKPSHTEPSQCGKNRRKTRPFWQEEHRSGAERDGATRLLE